MTAAKSPRKGGVAMTDLPSLIAAVERTIDALGNKIRADANLQSHYPDARTGDAADRRRNDAALLSALAIALKSAKELWHHPDGYWQTEKFEKGWRRVLVIPWTD
jgi:hypothetical protein